MADRLKWDRSGDGFRALIGPGRWAFIFQMKTGPEPYRWSWSVTIDGTTVQGDAETSQAAADRANEAIPTAQAAAAERAARQADEAALIDRIREIAEGAELKPEDMDFAGQPYERLATMMWHARALWAPSWKRAANAPTMPGLEALMTALSAEFARRRHEPILRRA